MIDLFEVTAEPGNLDPHPLGIAVGQLLLHALVECHLVPHSAPYLEINLYQWIMIK